jgi:DNA-binding CsgD family transcriptional regulator
MPFCAPSQLLTTAKPWQISCRPLRLTSDSDTTPSSITTICADHPRVNIKNYPTVITERIVGQGMWRRDPVIRGCIFTDAAFLWSSLPEIIEMDRRDHESLAIGAREGLNEGITVPCALLGQCMGSCTFAGMRQPERAGRFLGMAQMIGVFAFQAAKRIIGLAPTVGPRARLHPRPRDCVVLAGRGLSNKEIARALSLTPRTVDGYLTEARRLFDAHDRNELVVSAVLAGEVGLHELKRRQPE